MNEKTNPIDASKGITLVLGGTGKTGRRVAQRLKQRGIATRVASRSANPSFDWNDTNNWGAVLADVSAVYISYAPDLAIPGATEAVRRFVERCVACGVRRLVLLSGRGEQEAQACEHIVQASNVEWTIVRASWFMQNFSEGEFLGMVQQGAITLPASDIAEPFIDADDIADVAVAALTEAGHAGEVYEVTGPRLMTFSDLAREISIASGREIRFIPMAQDDFNKAITHSGAPADIVWLLNYLFATVLDGRNACIADGVQRALGRAPRDFADYARDVISAGGWNAAA
jgi:uncharacterized protein YbjT (DUF2867 family)